MTEDEAIAIARAYVSQHGLQADGIESTVHVTRERLDGMYTAARAERQLSADEVDLYHRCRSKLRSHWAIHFSVNCPNVVDSAGGPTVLIYDDNGKVELS